MNIRHAIARTLLTLFVSFLLIASARADIATGVAWLGTQLNVDGSIGNPATSIGVPLQNTAEALRAYQALGQTASPAYAAALTYLNAQDNDQAESLTRRIVANAGGIAANALVADLLRLQDESGGFSMSPEYTSAVIDTAFALEALQLSVPSAPAVGSAVGYLLSMQAADGSWRDGDNTPSVFTTALAMRALWYSRHHYPAVATGLARAETFLLTSRNGNGQWGDSFETALALTAIIPQRSDLASLQSSIDGLRNSQLANGSWYDDAYTTALALRALYLATLPRPNPDLSAIQGRIVDVQTGLTLSGVEVTLSGAASATVSTAADGAFVFDNLAVGAYQVSLSAPDYGSLAATTMTRRGQTTDLGILKIGKIQGATTGTITGTVTDGAGLALADVAVSVVGTSSSAATDVRGQYQVASVVPGPVSVTATKTGYSSATTTANITAGGLVIFSPTLARVATTPAIVGRIVASTGVPLGGATVTASDGTAASTQTDGNGDYQLDGLAVGTVLLQVNLTGYQPVTASTVLTQQSVVRFSPILYAEGTTPPQDANTSGVRGIVVDAGTDKPLAGARIVLRAGGATVNLTTGADGRFSHTGVSAHEVDMRFTADAYFPAETLVVVEPLAVLDIGQVRLRLTQAVQLLPDLKIIAVDRALASTDPQTLQLSGTLVADLTNIGTSPAAAAIQLVAFYDVNKNGAYDESVDARLGEASTASDVAVDAHQAVTLALQGRLPFRDAPIHVIADPGQHIVELKEDNNVATSASSCEINPPVGGFKPILKWAWRGSPVLPDFRQVMSAPAAAPLEDTNADGVIDENDTPAIVFNTFAGSNYDRDGVLRAISGVDGRELWTVTNPAHRTYGTGSIAIGDLDGDGKVEIISPGDGGSSVVVFDNRGQFKWAAPTASIRWGGATIADLDGDGKAEIVVANTVLNFDGTRRWQGTAFTGGGGGHVAPAVADINLNRQPVVVAGASAYAADGTVLWRNDAVGDGFVGIGNFNNDPYPEIAVVSRGRVFLLDHSGTIIWGPVALPGGGHGGPPTIADLDGDGVPEIGVAGALRYVVFKANGSILWSSPTQDASSTITGSSVFDFEGDGAAEVVYADELNLRIYRGRDGQVLFQTPNTSGTTLEQPLIVDVDSDNHADIVVTTNDYSYGGYGSGIRVYTDRDNTWANTRRIWNQHSYHVTNVNDDGSIPRHEQNSWQVHNTYRLNTFPGRSPTGVPDLSVGRMELIDNGAGHPLSLTLRAGNGGLNASRPTTIAVYQGDPAVDGVLLTTANFVALAASEYRDVRVDGIQLINAADLFAVIDSANTVGECDETNNRARIPARVTASPGAINISTDAATYVANGLVQLTTNVTNTGALEASYAVDVSIEDRFGAILAQLGTSTAGPLASRAGNTRSDNWNTSTTLTGTYTARAVLRTSDGALLSQSTTNFTIGTQNVASVSVRTITDRPTYHTTDTININTLIGNATDNTIVNDARVRIEVFGPNDLSIFTQTGALGELPPLSLREMASRLVLNNAAVATYRAVATVLNAANQVLASAQTQFEVKTDTNKALTGAVQLAASRIELGTDQTCGYTIANRGIQAINGVPVYYTVVNLDNEQIVSNEGARVDLNPGASQVTARGFTTTSLVAGNYACLVRAEINGVLATLGYANFVLTAPPIRVDAQMTIGDKGRLLILLDNNRCTEREDDHDHDDGDNDDHDNDHRSTNTSTTRTQTTGGSGDHHGDSGHTPRVCDNDPYGPQSAPTLSAQRVFLEALLKKAGYSYELVDDSEVFAQRLRSGGFSAYAIFAEHQKLDTQAQKELREAVMRGEGLIAAGLHDNRNSKLNEALGIKFIGQVHATAVDIKKDLLDMEGALSLMPGDRFLRIKRTSAQSAGLYVLSPQPAPRTDGHDDEDCREAEDHDSEPTESKQASTHDDACAGMPSNYLDAVTVNAYGAGRAALAAFDLLAAATRDGESSLSADLLRELLHYTHPKTLTPHVARVLPIVVTLKNQGIAVTARTTVGIPAGALVVDTGGGGQLTNNTLVFNTSLQPQAEKILIFYLRLPQQSGVVALTATVEASANNKTVLVAQPSLNITVLPAPTLTTLLSDLHAAVQTNTHYRHALDRAYDALQAAQRDLPKRPQDALKEAIKAADALLGIGDAQVMALRVGIAEWVRAVSIGG